MCFFSIVTELCLVHYFWVGYHTAYTCVASHSYFCITLVHLAAPHHKFHLPRDPSSLQLPKGHSWVSIYVIPTEVINTYPPSQRYFYSPSLKEMLCNDQCYCFLLMKLCTVDLSWDSRRLVWVHSWFLSLLVQKRILLFFCGLFFPSSIPSPVTILKQTLNAVVHLL